MSDLFFERVAFIGIGHIGSSLARVVLRDKLAGRITACANRAETLETVKRLKLADSVTTDPAAAVKDADLVVLATPLSAYGAVAQAIAPALRPGAILTDVGSVKSLVLREV
jgi:cyclohexadieny/prephenate dehydrogenase